MVTEKQEMMWKLSGKGIIFFSWLYMHIPKDGAITNLSLRPSFRPFRHCV